MKTHVLHDTAWFYFYLPLVLVFRSVLLLQATQAHPQNKKDTTKQNR